MKSTSVTGKNWILKKFDYNDVKKYTEEYSFNEIVAKLLAIRKKNIQNINFYINPTIKNLLPNPFKLKSMSAAIERTIQGINKNEINI